MKPNSLCLLQIKAVLGDAYKDAVTNYNTTDPKSSAVDTIQKTVSGIMLFSAKPNCVFGSFANNTKHAVQRNGS